MSFFHSLSLEAQMAASCLLQTLDMYPQNFWGTVGSSSGHRIVQSKGHWLWSQLALYLILYLLLIV